MSETTRNTIKPDLQRAIEIGQVGNKMLARAKKGLVKKKEVVAIYRLANQQAATDALSKVRNITKTEKRRSALPAFGVGEVTGFGFPALSAP